MRKPWRTAGLVGIPVIAVTAYLLFGGNRIYFNILPRGVRAESFSSDSLRQQVFILRAKMSEEQVREYARRLNLSPMDLAQNGISWGDEPPAWWPPPPDTWMNQRNADCIFFRESTYTDIYVKFERSDRFMYVLAVETI